MGPISRTSLALALVPLLSYAANDKLQTATFRSASDVVLIPATVLDAHNHLVRGLSARDFRLLEDKIEQPIRYFGEEELPLSLAVVFDTSGSMAGKISYLRAALANVLATANPRDEFCLIAFADHPELAVPWTTDPGAIESAVFSRPARGRTALLDAMQAGLAALKSSHNPRRAMVAFTDGGDNFSRISPRGFSSLLVEADAQLYAIDSAGFTSVVQSTGEDFESPNLLSDLCDRAGGRYFQVSGAKESLAVADQIGKELRSQYVLGYVPAAHSDAGKFHRVRVEVLRHPGQSRLSVFWRHGYRAPSDSIR